MLRLASLLLICVTGCGPLTFPMVQRLTEEEQTQVNDAWQNMFSPPQRLDHTLLLDVLLSMQLHQRGIDRLSLVSEKNVGDARVIMTIRFDREHPSFDEFAITYVDADGCELRRERYTSGEIEERLNAMQWGSEGSESSDPADTEIRRVRYEERMKQVQAATQPAS